MHRVSFWSSWGQAGLSEDRMEAFELGLGLEASVLPTRPDYLK